MYISDSTVMPDVYIIYIYIIYRYRYRSRYHGNMRLNDEDAGMEQCTYS